MNNPPELSGFCPLGPLGRGGTAQVIRVFSEERKRELALKYPLENDRQSHATFAQLAQREHQLIGQLKFPGLVRVLEISTAPPEYLLMELCPGPTLDQCGRIDNPALVLNLLSAIALNLEFLRAHAIIHGDLKPHNIFLPADWPSLDDNRLFYVKLSDFSLGRFSYEPDSDRVGLGTVGYMAPETIIQSRSTFQSDLFSLGVIAYQLLTGVHPFMDDESDPVKTNSRVREEDPIPLQTIRPDLGKELVDLIERLLAKNESDRPQSGWEVCDALRKAGARYPFEKALRPAHFFTSRKNYAEIAKSVLRAREKQLRRLNLLWHESNASLRLLLTANFIKGNLKYDGHRFVFSHEVYWPLILRRKTLSVFQQSLFGRRRLVVKAAIVGNKTQARKLEIVKGDELNEIPDALVEIIRRFVNPSVIKRYSSVYAARAERLALYELAARLYVQAGNLEGAERCAYQAALLLNKEHHNDRAIKSLNRVIGYAQMIGRAFDTRQLLMIKGDIQKENGETDLALTTYHQIISLYHSLPPDKLLAETYKDLGDLYRIKQNFEAGLKALNNALKIYQELHDELEVSHTLNNIGNIHWIASDLDAALEHYRSALRIQRRLNARADVATTLSNAGSIYAIKGCLKRSIRLMDLSLKLKKEIGNAGEIARTLNNLGYVYHLSGVPQRAVSCLSESLEINRRIGSKKEILFNLENLTAVMIIAGQLKESLRYLKEGMTLSEALGDRPHNGVFNLSMGTVLKRMGRFAEAEQRFARVDSAAREVDDKMLGVQVAIQRAGLRHFLGDNTQALDFALNALATAEQINDKSDQLNALLLIMKVSDDSRFVERALALVDELHLKREKTLINFNVIESLLVQGKVDEAYSAADKTLPELDQMSEDIELAWSCNVAAELMIARNHHQSALSYLSRAQGLANASGLMPEMVTTLTLRGRIGFSRGEYEQCYMDYKSALQACKKIAESIENDTDCHLYQNKRSTIFLVNEIRRLGELIGQKQRAGR